MIDAVLSHGEQLTVNTVLSEGECEAEDDRVRRFDRTKRMRDAERVCVGVTERGSWSAVGEQFGHGGFSGRRDTADGSFGAAECVPGTERMIHEF